MFFNKVIKKFLKKFLRAIIVQAWKYVPHTLVNLNDGMWNLDAISWNNDHVSPLFLNKPYKKSNISLTFWNHFSSS